MTCPHHWVIALPAGPVSKGRCKLCGEERYFHNVEGERTPAKTKVCSGCGETFPARPEFFAPFGLSIRLRARCRGCERRRSQERKRVFSGAKAD